MNVFWVLTRWLKSSFWLSTGHQKYQDRVKGRMGWKSSPNFNTRWTGDRVRWSFSSHWYNQSHVCKKTSVKPLKHQEWKSSGWLNLWRSPCHPPMPFCLHCSHLNIICIFCHSLQGVRGTLLYCCPTRSTGTGRRVCKWCLKWVQSCGTHCGVCWYLQVDGVKAELKYGRHLAAVCRRRTHPSGHWIIHAVWWKQNTYWPFLSPQHDLWGGHSIGLFSGLLPWLFALTFGRLGI